VTRLRNAAFVAVAVVFPLSLGAALYAQSDAANRTSAPPTVNDAILRRTGTADDALPGSWLSYGRDQSETRYSTLKQIDSTNANRLGLTWSYVMGAGGGNQEGTPIVWNNTLYGITSWSVVFALDARTGKEIWRWDPGINQPNVRPAICCGNVNRGIAIYNTTE
jgi:quinohemoprotein ethanol dehydrogenase